jgi:hypothetical protein
VTRRHRLSDEHLPADAVRVIPTEASISRGYIAETSTDAIFLNVHDPRQGTFTIIITPGLGRDIADKLTALCDKQHKLDTAKRRNQQRNGDNE